ncbi:hypothetical protein DFH27DRAFT_536108 [Peziza echinospora]|nr:hypothetical protein DFH27DRAFT_536108 [Peziza echinospora]
MLALLIIILACFGSGINYQPSFGIPIHSGSCLDGGRDKSPGGEWLEGRIIAYNVSTSITKISTSLHPSIPT